MERVMNMWMGMGIGKETTSAGGRGRMTSTALRC